MTVRKWLSIFIAVLLLAGLLPGCASPAQTPADDTSAQTADVQTSDDGKEPEPAVSGEDADPADEPEEEALPVLSVSFRTDLTANPDLTPEVPAGRYRWCQLAENGRLYGRTWDGGMELLLDRKVMSISQYGNLVAYGLGEDGGYFIDLDTGRTGCFTDQYVGALAALNGRVAYRMHGLDGWEGWEVALCVCDVSSGDTVMLAEHWKHATFLGGEDLLIYMDFVSGTATEELICIDCAALTELWRKQAVSYYAQLYMQDGELYGRDGASWFQMDARTQESEALPFALNNPDTLLLAGEDGVWVNDNAGEASHLLYVTADERRDAPYTFRQAGVPAYNGGEALALLTTLEHSDSLDMDYTRSRTVELTDSGDIEDVTALGKYGLMFASGDFPILDGSLARVPVLNEIYAFFCLENGIEGHEPVMNNTHGAWLALGDRTIDIALLAAPTAEEQAYLAEKGVEVEMKLYGGDGLVFIGNTACGVTDITVEQLKAIYRGEITNWKELGGVDHEIRVMYRNDQSGSQRLFEKMVWKGEEIPDFEALGFDYLGTMSTIVSECINDPYAFGYSIMTYLGNTFLGNTFYEYDELQTFSINGFEPIPENIRTGDYVYNTKGYVVIRADEPENSPARRLSEWFGSDSANQILLRNQISPISE